ncbi:MAG: flavin reductase family protein [Gammaproteobacteria bacterium]|nr:flavin reductase family protein [Gammaproteobacteria bacterium]NIM74761.1 flavin reductase family protein [Gammaproteobacteria bacterium]NIN39192.1 flavin reductase family protein [Gammaproteobacteria bacterium]NIO26678.1 flavin reductase family protein [Gammaproteobacteria bacterium]NIO67234.1 flavin reductase family protein [Gammaproteobacteria bacterium]
MFYETKNHHGLERNPFKSLIVPRPIGWISSQDRDGVVNLAPYSFFNGVCSDPPMVMFASEGTHMEGDSKDSATNAQATGEFVCNLATWELREAMNATSEHVPRSVNEFELAGLTPAPSRLVKPPRVKESPVHLECTHLQTVQLPGNDPEHPTLVVFGKVVGIHIDESIISDGMIDMSVFKPIARLGYMDYTVVDNVFTMLRP